MIPKKLTEAYRLIWAHCRECCGRRRTVVGDCVNTKCRMYDVKNMPRQISIFDAGFRDKFYSDIIACISLVKEEYFTIDDLKQAYYEAKKNQNCGTPDPHWFGNIPKRKEFLSLCKFVNRIKSTNPRSKGNMTIVWKKR